MDYWRYAFSEFFRNKDFVKICEEGEKKSKESKDLETYYETKEGIKALDRYKKRRKSEGVRLGIDKIIVINPFYRKIDARKGIQIEYIETEVAQINYREIIKEIAPKTSLKVDILDISNLDEKQVNQLNDIRFLNDWFSEQVDKYNLSLTPGSQQIIIDSLAKNYGTEYFLWTGVVSIHEKVNSEAIWSLLLPPYWVFAIPMLLQPNYDMLYYAILYDVKTGRREVINFDYFNSKDTNSMVKSHLYDTFTQIKNKPKDEKSSKGSVSKKQEKSKKRR
jgi:beta-barrel assembly-enhancing protease